MLVLRAKSSRPLTKIKSMKKNRTWIEAYSEGLNKTYYYHKKTKEVKWYNPDSTVEPIWIEAYSQGLNKTYYYHKKTKEVKWYNPEMIITNKMEDESKNVSISEDKSKNVSIPEDKSNNVSISEDKSKNVSISEDKSKNVSIPEDKSKNVSIPEDKSKNVSIPEDKSKNIRRSILIGIGTCTICSKFASVNKKGLKPIDWGYDCVNGPSVWQDIGVCKSSKSQSPVNIIKTSTVNGKYENIIFDYGEGDRDCGYIFNTGHGTMQVNFKDGEYITKIDNRVLRLVQFHFHTPSEHAIDGHHSAMEVHLVHKDIDTGQINVFGTLMDGIGQPNATLQACLEEAPSMYGEVPIKVDPNTLIPPPSKRTYFNYEGSLTTPPCSENVNWYIFENPIQCSSRQILNFQRYLKNGESLSINSRPLQPLNNRKIMYGNII